MARYQTNIITANGSTDPLRIYGPRATYQQRLLVFVNGVFGGGTATVQLSPDSGVTWISAVNIIGTPLTFTQPGYSMIDFASDADNPLEIRVNLTGASGGFGIAGIIFDTR